MKVLFVTNATEFGGAEVDLLNILRCLKRRGEAFGLACPDRGPFHAAVESEGLATVLPVDFGTGFGKWRGLNLCSPLTLLEYRRFKRVLTRAIDEGGYDVVHAQQDFKVKFFVSLAGKAAGIRVVWAEHGLLHPWISSTPFHRLYRALANGSTKAIVCPAQAVKNHLVGLGVDAEKIAVVHNGVPLPKEVDVPAVRRELGLTDDDLVAGTTARLYYPKGVQDLIRAVALLRDGHPRLRVMVVGDGKHRDSLERLVDEVGVRDLVVFAGFRSDAARLAAAFDIYVSPSFDTESLPLVILEAMAWGKPVVAVDVGGVAECVADGVNGFLVPPQNPEKLAEALGALAGDPPLRSRLGEKGKRRYLEEFTVDRMCDGIFEVLRAALC